MNLLGRTVAASVVFASLALPALAQDVRAASERVVACQDVEDSLERLACFETAASELSAVLSLPEPQVASSAETIQPSAPVAPAEQTVVAETVAPSAPGVAVTSDTPVQQASATTEPQAPRATLPSWIPRVTFGRDRDVEREPDEYRTQITRIQVNNIGRHFFTTADGHVWKQSQPGKIRAPKTLPAEVILSQNVMGGLQIKIEETSRVYSVQRVE